MKKRDFTHVVNFTGYMGIVFRALDSGERGLKILDLPAGNGLLAARLRERGHTAVCADINHEKPDYVFADMNQRLPFADGEFDAVVCMEGIEHTLHPTQTIGELSRITKPGGRIIVSLPNVQNIFSRFKFLCTGFFYQFSPWSSFHRAPDEQKDRGHISPMSYLQLRYHFQFRGAQVVAVDGDKWKKKWLIPFLLPFIILGWLWARLELRGVNPELNADGIAALRDLFSPAALFSRSLVLIFRKQ
jgi:SAM-dependent methyltransferase